jgi:hypothetical protein
MSAVTTREGDQYPAAIKFPHCDERVLHGPDDGCQFCDALPEWQTLREAWGIAFTGHPPEPGHLPCLADATRGLGAAHDWPGNRPTKFTTSPSAPRRADIRRTHACNPPRVAHLSPLTGRVDMPADAADDDVWRCSCGALWAAWFGEWHPADWRTRWRHRHTRKATSR